MRQLTVYLLRRSIVTAIDALSEAQRAEVSEYTVPLVGPDARGAGFRLGTLFLKRHDSPPPEWISFVGENGGLPSFPDRADYSGVLVLSAGRRRFAVTFNYGHSLIEKSAVESRFGLKASANLIDLARISVCDSHGLRPSRIAASKTSARGVTPREWDLEEGSELVTRVGGPVQKRDYFDWGEIELDAVAGADPAQVLGRFRLDDLQRLCKGLLVASRISTYKTEFPQLEAVRPVNRAASKVADSRLAALITAGQVGPISLLPPHQDAAVGGYRVVGVRDVGTIASTRYSLVGSSMTSRVLEAAAATANPVASLKRYSIESVVSLDSSNTTVVTGSWSAWECLQVEFADPNCRLVLDGGRWYEVDDDFVGRVNTYVDQFCASGISWPRYDATRDEDNFISQAVAGVAHAHSLHKKEIRLTGQSPVEPCDVYLETGDFVHVKRRSGGSATFSHLLTQASVSARLLVEEPQSRQQFVSGLPATARSSVGGMVDAFDPRSHRVILALLWDLQGPPNFQPSGLPLLARIDLYRRARDLANMGYSIAYDVVPT